MDPLIAGAVSWLLNQSMASLFDAAKNALIADMGLISTVKPLTRGEAQTKVCQDSLHQSGLHAIAYRPMPDAPRELAAL